MELALFDESSVDTAELEAKLEEYRRPANRYDRHMLATLKAMETALERVDSGAKVINLVGTLRAGGVFSPDGRRRWTGLPALGFAPARYGGREVKVVVTIDGSVAYHPAPGRWLRIAEEVTFPSESFPEAAWGSGTSVIPVTPPRFRPLLERKDLIVWEARWQTNVPDPDPAILRPIGNGLAEVIAEWDLTPLEAEALRYV